MYPEIFKEYGKLADNSVGVGKSEDWEYYQRIRNKGFKVGYIDPQIIGHCGLTDSEGYRDWETDRKSTRLNSSHSGESRMPSSA